MQAYFTSQDSFSKASKGEEKIAEIISLPASFKHLENSVSRHHVHQQGNPNVPRHFDFFDVNSKIMLTTMPK